MIDRGHALPLVAQAQQLGISRGSIYYLPRAVSSADLTIMRRIDVPWVMPPRGTFPRRRFEQVIADIGMRQPHVAVETRSVMMMKGLVAESGFLSWLPRPLYAAEERADLIAPLDVAGMFVNRQAYLYRRRHGSTPPVAVRFLETVRAMYG
ncbi:MAG: transcriptional regulator, LysR family [Sphingomonas bacterium]|nr:transcriptional regulator, LysR family [Sphingomonas bacterium]